MLKFVVGLRQWSWQLASSGGLAGYSQGAQGNIICWRFLRRRRPCFSGSLLPGSWLGWAQLKVVEVHTLLHAVSIIDVC